MRFRVTALFSVSIYALSAFGQTSTSFNNGPQGFSGSTQFSAPRPFILRSVVTGAPYSGDEVDEQVQVLADGTRITHGQPPTKMYRDSLGRTRTERALFRGMPMAGGTPESPLMIEITDPVAKVKYTLDSVNKVAHRQQLPAAPEMAARRVAVAGASTGTATTAKMTPASGQGEVVRPQFATERLGTRTIEGVLAMGTRLTNTWPTVSQDKDRPFSVVTETWMATDLKVMVLSTSNDPRTGEHTQKLTNVSLGEPPASLFQPPPEFSVVDETGPFTVKWGSQ